MSQLTSSSYQGNAKSQIMDTSSKPVGIEQIDSKIFAIAILGYGSDADLIDYINWLNNAGAKYTLSKLRRFEGIILKIESDEDAVHFKLAMVDEQHENES